MALELVYLETGQWKHSSERPSAFSLAHPPLVLLLCVTGWSSWIFKVGKTLYSVQK